MVGAWKDFEEMEVNLSLPELEAILDAARKRDREHQRFAAALKGVNLDDEQRDTPTGDDIRRRAEAKMRGMTEEEYDFAEVGIAVEIEE